MRCIISLLLVAASSLASQTDRSTTTAAAATARLRGLWYRQAYLDGMNEGVRLAHTFSSSPEVRAWFIINYSTAGYAEQAVDSAQALAKQLGRSAWTDAARAFAISQDFERGAEAIPAARRAYRAAPRNVDIALINATVLQRYGKYAEAVAFLDSVIARSGASAELLAAKGQLLMLRSRQKDADSTVAPRARAAFAEAQRLEPNNVNAWYKAASSLDGPRGDTIIYALAKKAAQLSPSSSAVHLRYWSAISALRNVPDSVKAEEIQADLSRFLDGHQDDPAFLYPSMEAYSAMKQTEKRTEIEERILREFPTRRQAEMVLYNRLTNLGRTAPTGDTAAAKRAYRELVKQFIARPYHFSSSTLGSVYLDYYIGLRGDSTTADADLLAAIRGAAKYNRINPQWTHYTIPLFMADRKLDLPFATQLANESLKKWEIQLDGASLFNTAGEMVERRASITAQKYDMLGWIAFNNGRLVEAEQQLERARELTKQNSLVYYHQGRVAEAQGNLGAAEQFYARGYQVETSGFSRGKENVTQLSRLYSAKHASLDGFDAYVEALKEEDRGRRKAKIAESRIKDPQTVPSFSLERLSLDSLTGGRVTSASLRGKIAVINFWGVWCGPCVAEMPELQKFHERVKGDTSVVFLTIDYNDTQQGVKDWMLKQKYTMPVLLDDGYVSNKARITAYPTTWFVDRDGNIIYSHKGASDVVLEEFLWRVEMLKAGRVVP
ncbi:MAG TPA: redoxin domain-containing protein [Gemmatimonadaceae bacterium]